MACAWSPSRRITPNIVAMYIVVQTGSRNEVEPGHTGFAHLFEHLMFRGTEKFPPEKYNQILKRIGRGLQRLHERRSHGLPHDVFQGRPGDDPGDGGRPLPASEISPSPSSRRRAWRCWASTTRTARIPISKLNEVLHDTAFDRHTYKHTTMGFLKDVQDMPNQYDYSLSSSTATTGRSTPPSWWRAM